MCGVNDQHECVVSMINMNVWCQWSTWMCGVNDQHRTFTLRNNKV